MLSLRRTSTILLIAASVFQFFPLAGHADCHDGSPLILDLNGDGVHTSNIRFEPVDFDINGDGLLDRIGWTSPYHEEGILWLDLNRNRAVDGGRELFGTATVLPSGELARNGFEALAAYDDAELGGNGDGRIDRYDLVWRWLRAWVDRNHDGMANPGEVHRLRRIGVMSLPIEAEEVALEESMDGNTNLHRFRASYWKAFGHPAHGGVPGHPERRLIEDVFFRHVTP